MTAQVAFAATPQGLPDPADVLARAREENFPVALRLLAPSQRRALLAVYGFARLADELGDELSGDRLAALDWLERELDRAYVAAAHLDSRPPVAGATPLARLPVVLGEYALPREPFTRLIDANRLDQRVTRYETWQQLRGYCHLSADPVGELVLSIFAVHTPERVKLSDRVCTGLQLTEHLQDVAEDLRRGRVYLPAEDLERFGCSREQPRGEPLRRVIAFESVRARELLYAGIPLAAGIGGRAKLAVAAFAAGGLAALEQIERGGYEVSGGVAGASRGARLRWLVRLLRGQRRVKP